MFQLIKALKIFAKYGDKSYPTGCEHDTLYVYYDPAEISSEDIDVLDDLGFHADSHQKYFYSFQYGSA